MMAHQLPPEAVLHQGRRAIGAFQPVPAGPAQRQGCIAPPVEEQQRLVALGQRFAHLLEQRGGEPRAGLKRHALHVDEADLGKLGPPMPVHQPHHAVAAAVDAEHAARLRVGVLGAVLAARLVALGVGPDLRGGLVVLGVLLVLVGGQPAHASMVFHNSTNWGRVLAVEPMSSTSTPGIASPMIAPAVAIRWSS